MTNKGSLKFGDSDGSREWENGTLGQSAEHLEKSTPEDEKAIDDTLGLTPITLRLQKTLVEQLKKMAAQNGLGYQPFVRQILTQYVREQTKSAAVR
jgi:predicted DNA binding CopG/RHH family protein